MEPDIRWIEAVYGAERQILTHIAVPGTARSALHKMADELVGTNALVAFYMPVGTDDVYTPGLKRGRVFCAVQLLPMPPNGKIEQYFYNDLKDGSRRWPIGWPARLVYAPPVADCPSLREHVVSLFGEGSFAGYVSRFQKGPFRLELAMRERLNSDFAQFVPVE
jgi:hypothetical protein